MRALANDQRINGVSYGWEGARNASPSVQRVNGAVVRRCPDGLGVSGLKTNRMVKQ